MAGEEASLAGHGQEARNGLYMPRPQSGRMQYHALENEEWRKEFVLCLQEAGDAGDVTVARGSVSVSRCYVSFTR
jgi:hypothetical protein